MPATPKLRGTPTRSPLALGPSPGARPRSAHVGTTLELDKIIGLTCTSLACLSTQADSRSFAYAAGAAVVVATLDQGLNITQQFYRCTVSVAEKFVGSNASLCLSPSHAGRRETLSVRSAREGSPTTNLRLSPNVKSSSPSERVKAVSAISLSPNGRWLAVGETGYKPRVLIYARDESINNTRPVVTIAEHSYGIHSVAFSPDSSLLATLGTVHDGFLRIWTVEPRTGALTLLATNKCTNLVCQICWMGRNLVCVGVRFVKVWRPDELAPAASPDEISRFYAPSPGNAPKEGVTHRPLIGRNTLLGDLLEATFTALVATSSLSAVICTEAGSICILDDTDRQQRLVKVRDAGFQVNAVTHTPDRKLIVAGANDRLEVMDLPPADARLQPATPKSRPASPCKMALSNESGTMALACMSDTLLSLDAQRKLQLYQPLENLDLSKVPQQVALPSHGCPILGVHVLAEPSNNTSAAFVTWSADGAITGWSNDGHLAYRCDVPLDDADDGELGELRTVANLKQGRLLVTGDRYGVMSVMDPSTQECVHKIRAHSAAVTSMAVHDHMSDGQTLIASCSRDRTVQVFKWHSSRLSLIQTLCEHVGAVTGVAFSKDGLRLVSCSADRTVVVRNRTESQSEQSCYEITRTIALKAAPTSMHILPDDRAVLISSLDKMVHCLDMDIGRTRYSFKTADQDGGDAVSLSAIISLPFLNEHTIIAGVASSDKSIRLYTNDGTLMAREWGHTEGVAAIASLWQHAETSSHGLVSVAADGTMFIWKTVPGKSTLPGLRSPLTDMLVEGSPTKQDSPLSRPPLRKVMSMSGVGRSYLRKRQPVEDSESESSRSTASPTRVRRPMKLEVSGNQTGSRLKPRRSTVDLASSRFRTPSPCSPRSSIASSAGSQFRPSIARAITLDVGPPMSSPAQPRTNQALEPVKSSRSRGEKTGPEHVLATLRDYRTRIDTRYASDKENTKSAQSGSESEAGRGRTRDEEQDKTTLRFMEMELERTLGLVRARLQGVGFDS